jgi:hypothetical protein
MNKKQIPSTHVGRVTMIHAPCSRLKPKDKVGVAKQRRMILVDNKKEINVLITLLY